MKIAKKAIVVAGIALVILMISFIVLSLSFGGVTERSFYIARLSALRQIKAVFEKAGSLDIDDVCRSGLIVTFPYDSRTPSLVILPSESHFYKKSLRYKIIRCDDWWGIVELEYGIIGKYFLMITKDGEIIKFDKPFLPEQKLAEYPPKYDIEKHIYPAYLDKLPVAAQTNVSAKPEDQKGKDATPDPK